MGRKKSTILICFIMMLLVAYSLVHTPRKRLVQRSKDATCNCPPPLTVLAGSSTVSTTRDTASLIISPNEISFPVFDTNTPSSAALSTSLTETASSSPQVTSPQQKRYRTSFPEHNVQKKHPEHNAQQKHPEHNAQQNHPDHNTSQKRPGHNTLQKRPGHNTLQKQYHTSFPEQNALPHHEYLKSSDELKNTTWVADLHHYLMTLNRNVTPHVNLVFADYKHRILVVNWVVAATLKVKPPLHNVLVLSLDQLLCNFLASSMLYMNHPPDITCIAAPVDTMLSSKGDNLWRASMMIRPIILRLINYWGFDVATYDSDAVVLKNPQTLFEKYTHDILSSASMWPDSQAIPWGFTLCAGAILYRATSATGIYLSLSTNNVGRTICNSRFCVVDHE